MNILGISWDFFKIHWKTLLSPYKIKHHFQRQRKEMYELCIYSEFHQVSCGLIYFDCILSFMGEKWWQSWPIWNTSFWRKDANGSTLLVFFTDKVSLTAKSNVSTRNLVKFWINTWLIYFFSIFFLFLRKWYESRRVKAWFFNVF